MIDKLAQLAWAFAQVGIGAFGGGLSTLTLIEDQLVRRMGWLTPEGFGQVLALAQVTPGPIAINAATLVGYQQAGIAGAVVATSSLVIAPLSVVMLVMRALEASPRRAAAFRASIAPIVAALLTLAVVSPLRVTLAGWPVSVALFLISIPLITRVTLFKKYPPLLFLLMGAASLLLN